MIGPAMIGTALGTPLQTLEDLTDRLRRVSLENAIAPELTEALKELTGLRLLDQLGDFISIKDRQGRYLFTNQSACRVVGIDDCSVLSGRTDFDFLPRASAEQVSDLERQVVETGSPIEKREERLAFNDGRMLWLSISKTALRNGAGDIVGIVTVARDITERKRQEQLRHGHARLLEMIARGQPLTAVLDALVLLVEAQLSDIRGAVMLLEEGGTHLTGGIAPSLPPAYVALIDGIEIGASRGSCGTAAWRREAVLVEDVQSNPLWEDFRELGTLFGFRSCWSTPIIGAEAHVLGTFALYSSSVRAPTAPELELMNMATDLAGIAIERAESERRIRHLAHHDPLTGLPNRTLFWSQFNRSLHEARRENRKVTVAYIDLDNFKSINDTLGHAAGDHVLKVLADRMARCIRASDLIVRLGGDEFAIVFSNPDGDRSGVLRRLDKLRGVIAEPVWAEGTSVEATCSMGVAFYPEDGELAEDLLASADHAMYESKELGRDRLTVCA
ncbi:diguanylate cyclase [Neorhizobium sp. NCHU2750]|uniref:diguanylate cyclase domain-containing protein n=1 Tax=Neorhizobium sp. NCHU2750 TaxID=1825976 RepID=UPI000EB68E58|nr:histidine kinase [Neorhizobium sp. NCHU2750]